jgi:PKD repeat protein
VFRLLLVALFVLTVALFGCGKNSSTNIDSPTITGMTPAEVFLGQQNVNGQITGTNFSGVVAVDLGAGIKIENVEGIDATLIKVKFSVSNDAPSGPRTITVANAGGKTSNSSVLSVATNRAPVVSFTVDPPRGGKDTMFRFDASTSHDPDGKISQYDWDFGNGQTGTGRIVTHRYNRAGSFQVTLTVTDNHQGKGQITKSVVIENNNAPIPHYTVSPPEGSTTTIFRFDGSRSTDRDGRIAKYEWDFKDGTIGRGTIAHHRFERNSTYSVKLTVTDNDGAEGFLEKELRVRGKPPVARFQISPSAGDSSTNFQFDASSSEGGDGNITRYDWNFGDGNAGSGKITHHKYSHNGSFNITLKVTASGGLESSNTKTLNVSGDSPPPSGGTCHSPAPNRGFIYGTVIGVQGLNAIVQLPAGSTCANSYYHCGDMRRASPEEFRGIIHGMSDLGNYRFSIFNDCPFRWPPAIGERVFLYWKSCSQNFCP